MSSIQTIYLNVGELIVAKTPVVVSTVLGSCISVCLFNKERSAGGIIHFALPRPGESIFVEQELRYGEFAIPQLVEELRNLTGNQYTNFQAKIVGGGIDTKGVCRSSFRVGSENIRTTRAILSDYGIPIVGESVGGESGRRVIFHIPSGRLQVAKMRGHSEPVSNSRPAEEKIAAFASKSNFSQSETKIGPQKRKVLIVDDSKSVRDLLCRILEDDLDLQIIGVASNAVEAANIVAKTKPDVITLDIHMPIMTGVQWLEKLLPTNPIPVVMISSLQLQEGNEVFRALELGAVDYIQKPIFSELAHAGPIIREKVKEASHAKVIRHHQTSSKLVSTGVLDMTYVLAIGASTGGIEALKSVICSLPERIPPTVVVQHIPPVFSKTFADRMNQLCLFEVKEAEDKDELRPSRVLIAPGGKQMRVEKSTRGFRVRLTDDSPVNRHKPSVDYLFNSVASVVGKKSVGVILTGMGNDGAQGLLAMRKKGSHTIGQDEESSVVYGMPRVASQVGAVEQVASLSEIPRYILNFLEVKKAA